MSYFLIYSTLFWPSGKQQPVPAMIRLVLEQPSECESRTRLPSFQELCFWSYKSNNQRHPKNQLHLRYFVIKRNFVSIRKMRWTKKDCPLIIHYNSLNKMPTHQKNRLLFHFLPKWFCFNMGHFDKNFISIQLFITVDQSW